MSRAAMGIQLERVIVPPPAVKSSQVGRGWASSPSPAGATVATKRRARDQVGRRCVLDVLDGQRFEGCDVVVERSDVTANSDEAGQGAGHSARGLQASQHTEADVRLNGGDAVGVDLARGDGVELRLDRVEDGLETCRRRKVFGRGGGSR